MTAILVVSLFAALSFVAIPSVQASPDPATIYVNTTGWWREGGAFNETSTRIQDAIYNATTGETIIVQDGIYNESVVVNKSLTIRSQNGSAVCTVKAANSNNHTFNVTVSWVNITGFTVTNATGTDKAGIKLYYNVQYCNISANNITGNYYGIYLNTSSNNTIRFNNITNNTNSGIHVDSGCADNLVNFNNIEGNTGTGVYGVYNHPNNPFLDARYNWWGNASGPGPVGSGDNINGNVTYNPWLTAPVASKTGTNEWLGFPGLMVYVYVKGSAEAYVATYSSNPGKGFTGDIDSYIDVYVPDISHLSELEIQLNYTDEIIEALGLDELSLRMYWWNGTNWLQCSNTGVDTGGTIYGHI